jgi:hypothetical protein
MDRSSRGPFQWPLTGRVLVHAVARIECPHHVLMS